MKIKGMLQPLDQWNCERMNAWADKLDKVAHPELHGNGLICPKCDHELYDTGQFFPGRPPQLRVKCTNLNCDFKGERYE